MCQSALINPIIRIKNSMVKSNLSKQSLAKDYLTDDLQFLNLINIRLITIFSLISKGYFIGILKNRN